MRTVIIFCLCLSAFAAQAQNDVNYTYMDSLFQQLPEVLVKGERPVVKAERGKLVYDLPRMVERLPVNNAYEAVKELPGIVEQDGNLTLGGRSITLVVMIKSCSSSVSLIIMARVCSSSTNKTCIFSICLFGNFKCKGTAFSCATFHGNSSFMLFYHCSYIIKS